MALSPELVEAAAVFKNPLPYMMAAPSAIILGTTAAKIVTTVHKSEVGIRMRRGSPLVRPEFANLTPEQIDAMIDADTPATLFIIEEKRLVFLRPFVESLIKVNVSNRTTSAEEFPFETTDDKQVMIHPAFTWSVRRDGNNPYRSRFLVNNEKDNKDKDKDHELEQTITWACAAGLGIALRNKTYDELRNYDKKDVTRSTEEVCHDELLKYGVQLNTVHLKSVSRTPAQINFEAINLLREQPQTDVIAAIATTAIAGNLGLQLVPNNEPA